MSVFNLKSAALALVTGVSLAGCAYGPYGGVGAGVGYGNSNGYYDPYYNGGYYNGGGYYGAGYGGYPYGYGGYGYGSPYYGWNDGFYYPGTGYYVYDRDRRPHRWTDAQRRYWERRRGVATSGQGMSGVIENWADFQNGRRTTDTVVRQRSVATNTGTNHTFTEPAVRTQRVQTQDGTQSQSQRRTARTEVQQDRRGNGGGRNRHVDND